jgi:hypothetical protein
MRHSKSHPNTNLSFTTSISKIPHISAPQAPINHLSRLFQGHIYIKTPTWSSETIHKEARMCLSLALAAIFTARADRRAEREAMARANPQVIYVQGQAPTQEGYPVAQVQHSQLQLPIGPPGYEKQALHQNVAVVPVTA